MPKFGISSRTVPVRAPPSEVAEHAFRTAKKEDVVTVSLLAIQGGSVVAPD